MQNDSTVEYPLVYMLIYSCLRNMPVFGKYKVSKLVLLKICIKDKRANLQGLLFVWMRIFFFFFFTKFVKTAKWATCRKTHIDFFCWSATEKKFFLVFFLCLITKICGIKTQLCEKNMVFIMSVIEGSV